MFSPRRSSLIALILLVPLGLLAEPSSAQVVRGRLLDGAGGAGVRGGVVTLVDTTGAEVAQVLSGASGSYRLTAPGPGRYRVLVERIGDRDVETKPFGLRAGQVVERDLSVTVHAISFEGLTPNGPGLCTLQPKLEGRTRALWSAVRTALTATKLTRVRGGLRYDEAEYARALDPGTLEREARPTVTVRSGLAQDPFVSAPVERLVRDGFVERGARGASYYAPDAEVLLSGAFLESHCLQLVLPQRSDTAEAGAVGLAFRALGRRTVSDVRGTLWVAAATDELRTLEYRYTGLDVPDSDEVGGRVDFARLPSGLWIVSRWYVRTPVMSEAEPPERASQATSGGTRPRVAWIMERGGVIIAARDTAGERVYGSTDPIALDAITEETGRRRAEAEAALRRQLPPVRAGTVRGRLLDATTGSPLQNILLMLSAGADSTGPWSGSVSGPDGTFSFSGVAPGSHRLRARSVGYANGAWRVQVPPQGVSVLLRLQSRPVPLEGLTVRARAGAAMRGFERRRKAGFGTFIDRAQIEKEAPARSTDLLRTVPGIHVQCPGVTIRCRLATNAPPSLVGPDAGSCPVQYFLDGMPVSRFSLDDLLPAEIEAIEVYPHAAEVPAQFTMGNSRCGVVVVWTRGR